MTKKKSAKHPHSHGREVVLQALYQVEVANHTFDHVLQFGWLNEPLENEKQHYCQELIKGIGDSWEALDQVIQSFSHKDISQISIINRCILRIGIYELMKAELDHRIIMDDLLNLTRKYDGEESVPFINGIIDRFERERRTDSDDSE